MKNYQKIIEEEKRDPKFYLPIINLFERYGRPLSIKEVAKFMDISYSAAKSRLHKLNKWGIAKGTKRGYYCSVSLKEEHKKIPKGKLIFLNGCVRITSKSNNVGITVYNSKFGETAKGEYCRIEKMEDKLVIRKSNKFFGSKIHFLISKSVGISVPRKILTEKIISTLSYKVTPINVGIYLDEWELKIKDIFSTESREEGELAEELDKFGVISKKKKFDDLKADIVFTKKNVTIPIEITNTSPLSHTKFRNSRKSGVKSALIFERLYFFIRWNLIYKSPTILILNKEWEKIGWLKKEQEFMKKFNCHVIFTDFQGKWAKAVSYKINCLTDLSLTNKTTRLALE